MYICMSNLKKFVEGLDDLDPELYEKLPVWVKELKQIWNEAKKEDGK